MRIGIDCRLWGEKHAGLGRYVKNLVINLLKVDKKNEYVLFMDRTLNRSCLQNGLRPVIAGTSGSGQAMKQFNNVAIVKCSLPYYSLKEQLFFPRIIDQQSIDLFHFTHFNAPFFCKGKFVVTIHDLIKHQSRGMETTTRNPLIYRLKYLGYKAVFKNTVQKTAKIIVPSNFVKKQLINEYPFASEKIRVIYEGANKISAKCKVQSAKLILGKYKLKKPFCIYTGSAYPHKNLKFLIKAFVRLNKGLRKPVILAIACGRSIFWERLKKQVKGLEATKFVKLLGFVTDEDLAILYSQATAFITASLMEGFGLPGLEAMAVGCPVIAAKKGSLPEIYDKGAIFFDPRNENELMEKIKKILELSVAERKKLTELGIKQVKKYSWEKCARETLRVYESVV